MNIDDFAALVKERQSCRSFDKDRIPEREKLRQIMDITLLSPSACNSQPWNFIVAEGALAREVSKYTAGVMFNKFTASCPCFIVIIEDKASIMERFGERFKDQDFISNDIGIATAHLVLAAKASGLETCILGMFNEKKLKELLGIKVSRRIRLVVAVGYATEGYALREKDRKKDKPVEFRC